MDTPRARGDDMTPDAFLITHGWQDAVRHTLAGDASARRYIRLCSGPRRAILMIDPQDDTDRFAAVATHLRQIGLSSPEIMAHAPGLLLLEDFGDAQFADVVAQTPDLEIPLYGAATDVLCHLETAPLPKGVPIVSAQTLGQMIEPAFTQYLPMMGVPAGVAASAITDCLTDLLDRHLPRDRVLVLRDFHAENLIWLPDRTGLRRCGLLDFQDALAGPPVYDLVSMLQDARRDVSPACHDATFRHYLARTGRTETDVLALFHLLGVQRNLRILGIFARLARDRGKPAYLSLIPRVWGHVTNSLNTPVAQSLRPLVEALFPRPTPALLGLGAS